MDGTTTAAKKGGDTIGYFCPSPEKFGIDSIGRHREIMPPRGRNLALDHKPTNPDCSL
jgi:hypothetical protein